MEMQLRPSPLPERKPSPRVTREEAGQILKEEKAKDRAERKRFEAPEGSAQSAPLETISDASLRPLHDSFISLDADRKRKLGSLKAEANRLTTEEYLTQGRGAAAEADRKAHLERLAEHEAAIKRGEDIRRAREAEESLLGRFKKSLATMNKRLFGTSPLPERKTKPGNEQTAERPE